MEECNAYIIEFCIFIKFLKEDKQIYHSLQYLNITLKTIAAHLIGKMGSVMNTYSNKRCTIILILIFVLILLYYSMVFFQSGFMVRNSQMEVEYPENTAIRLSMERERYEGKYCSIGVFTEGD